MVFNTSTPTLDNLPECYRSPETLDDVLLTAKQPLQGTSEAHLPIPAWLTGYWDELIVSGYAKALDIRDRQLNPSNCDVSWLDFLAVPFGWSVMYWDSNWSEATKRTLLANTYQGQSIWENKGTLTTLSFVLTTVGHPNQAVVEGDFIIGVNEVGDALGVQPWEYTLYLPPRYENSPQLNEVLLLCDLFQPAWVKRNVIYDESRFLVDYLLITEDGEVVITEDDEGIQIDEGTL